MVAVVADRLGFDVVWAAEAYGSDAVTRARRHRRPDLPDRHRVGGAADPRPHAGDDRDDRRDPGRAVRRPVPARARRLRAAGLRGLARRRGSPTRSAGPAEYVEIVRQALPRRRVAPRRRALPCRCPTAPGKALMLAFTRCATTSRSTWPRSGRRTSNWPARSPTAGWRIFFDPEYAAGRARIARPAAAAAGPAGILAFDVAAPCRCPVGAGSAVGRRPGPRVRRALHRRDGVAEDELLSRLAAAWASVRRPTRCRTGSWPATTRGGRRGAVRVHRPHVPDRRERADRRAAGPITPATGSPASTCRCSTWPGRGGRIGRCARCCEAAEVRRAGMIGMT